MPDQLLTEASKPFLDGTVAGSLCVILALVLAWAVRIYRIDIKAERDSHEGTREKLQVELGKERDAHQRTRDAQIIEIRQFATLSDSIRDQQKATETTIQAVLDLLRERDRR